MRNAFIRGLSALAERDDRVVLLTGDLGFKIFDDFARRFPGRFINAGVAEANMAGVAAGMAMDGLRPFIYSIVPFATLRCFEQIRNDICYHNLPVTIVGVGGGFAYGPNGPTHHALEDIAVMRTLPNLTVVCPGDPVEAELSVLQIGAQNGPVYLRLGRAGDPVVHRHPPEFRIGSAITLQPGSDCVLISTGGILSVAMEAAGLLRAASIEARVVNMHTVKPLDSATLAQCCGQNVPVFTIEEHSQTGGLGSAIGEWLSEHRLSCRLSSIGAGDHFAHRSGSQNFLRAQEGLTAAQVAQRVTSVLEAAAC
jgi:transketolase